MDERILVVDDDERLGAVLRDGLSHHGFVVEVAGDGQLALLLAVCLGGLALFLSVAVVRVLTENLDHTLQVQA